MAWPNYYAFCLCGYTAWPAYFDNFDVWPHGLASSKKHFFRWPHCAIFWAIDRFLGSIDRSLVRSIDRWGDRSMVGATD